MRLAFFRPSQAVSTPEQAIPFQTGVPASCGSTIKEHLFAARLVGNLGNMIHRTAMVQMLDFDRDKSAQINLFRLMKSVSGPQGAADILNASFDGLVITMSNILRENAVEPELADLIRLLTIPVYCLGVGLQHSLDAGDASALRPEMLDLVRTLDERAALFGVRGKTTLSWLRSIGIKNAKALGCPSMFAYPKNVLSTSAPVQPRRIVTAGHLRMTTTQTSRGHKLMRGFRGVRATYVFQGEPTHFHELLEKPEIYDEATQTLNADTLTEYISKKCGADVPFDRYHSFADVAAWRQAYLSYDAYAGDRIHGGVAALQVGVPALILYADARVMELTEFHGIPSCSLDEFEETGCRAAIEKHLNKEALDRFHERYSSVLCSFEQAVAGAGLKLVNRLTE